MRTYKYPIRTHPKTKRLGNMLDDLADLKRHILTLEQRYYRRYGKYLGRYRLQTASDEVASENQETLGVDTS